MTLLFPFGLALFTALFGTVFLTKLHLIAFAPFLAIVYTRKNFVNSLWLSCVCGLIMDLLTSELRFGIYSLNYCLTTVLLYHQRRHFFEDKPLALCLYTTLISAISSGILLFLMSAFNAGITFSWTLVLTDLFLMPFADGLYAFLWFMMPMKLYKHIQKIGIKSLWAQKKVE